MVIKKCQIHATSPITCFTVPIVGTTQLNLTPDEIYKCLCAKAEVMEILANGKMINLDFSNYNRDNSIIGEPVEEVKEEPSGEIDALVTEVTETVFVTGLSTELDDEITEIAETITTSTEDDETVIEADELVSIEDEIAETVKEFKVESRNNNNHKNNKNKKKK